MNDFESGARKAIPAVLVYLRSGDQVLMLHRTGGTGAGSKGKADYHLGKWNGLGGKLEPDESPHQAASREVFEESGIRVAPERFQMLGILQFPNFKAHVCEDWIVWVLIADVNAKTIGDLREQGVEGDLHWIPEKDLLKLSLWPGDRQFIPLMVNRTPFAGTIWYVDGEVSRVELRRLGSAT